MPDTFIRVQDRAGQYVLQRLLDVGDGSFAPSVALQGASAAPGAAGSLPLTVQGGAPLYVPATIANGASTSGWIDLGSATLVRIMLPAVWTGTDITLSVATDAAGSDADDLYDASGNEYRIRNCAASRAFNLPPADTYGIRFVRLRSGTSAAPVAQAEARSITLICKP